MHRTFMRQSFGIDTSARRGSCGVVQALSLSSFQAQQRELKETLVTNVLPSISYQVRALIACV